MDPLPLIPENYSSHEVTYTLRGAFQNTLDGRTYPHDIARNIFQNDVDKELELKQNASEVLQVYFHAQGTVERIQHAENDIMVQKGLYMIKKDEIRKDFALREHLKLKKCDLFKTLEKVFVDEFGLLQSSDLLPEIVRQYLDFRYFTSTTHICKECLRKSEHEKFSKIKKKKRKMISEDDKVELDEKSYGNILKIIPNAISFHNFELGQIYSKKLKILNTSLSTQSVSLKKLPSLSCFSINLDHNSRLAPGMSVSAVVNFKPELYRNHDDEVIFKNGRGDTSVLLLKCSRDIPRLITCILNSSSDLLEQSRPGNSNFLERRREALNSTIDCRSCLVSQYTLVSIIVENKGMPGKFFLIPEDEWFLQYIGAVTNSMELVIGDFWIYPTFFEVDTDEIVEMNVIFQPTRPGLHVETLYIICDNNSFQQLEVMGDAVEFSKSFITIDVLPGNNRISGIEDYCLYLGSVDNESSKYITLTVHNKSSLYLDCLWKFRNKYYEGVYDLCESWVTQQNENRSLIPYSTTDFNFEISMDATTTGYHSIFISFFILNIPLASLAENENFTYMERIDIYGDTLSEAVDIRITELEVACFIDFPVDIEQLPESTDCKDCSCIPKLTFSTHFLHFGIIPTGLRLQKELNVNSNTDEQVHWMILEVKYNIDSSPHFEMLRKENLSCSSGKFMDEWETTCIQYKIHSKVPMSWVSILVLISINDEETSRIESICVVTYEVIDYDIVINTGQATAPILCPLKLIYVNIPIEMKLTIENRSPITGCFYFLKPNGTDSDKISVKFEPNSAVLKRFEKMDVNVKLCCSEIGIFDNLFVPCFIGKGQDPIMMRLLCAVDGVHVAFYLPEIGNGYRKLIWPPKVVYDYDWSHCSCEQEECLEYETNLNELRSKLVENSPKTSFGDATEQTFSTGTLNSDENARRLEKILRDQFADDVFLLEEIVEIHDLSIRTPRKITIFVENITPIETNFTIQAQNFVGNNEISMMDVLLKKKDDIWDELISDDYGILVYPELENGPLPGFDSASINVWVYANTYGIYSEEIMVDIPEIPSFSFSLLIEVVGNPITFPMTLNSSTYDPIIRFGSLPYSSQPIRRQIRISNTSCVPVHIIWHTFQGISENSSENKINICFDVIGYKYTPAGGKLIMFDNYLGENTNECCGIESEETDLDPHSTSYIELFLKPGNFKNEGQQIDLNCYIIGHIYLEDEYRSKLNYFFRKTSPEENQIKMEIQATLEQPLLQQDVLYGKTKLIFYANDVILRNIHIHYVRLVFRNNNQSICEAILKTMDPFSIRNQKNEMIKEKKISLKSNGCEEVLVACFMDLEKILALSTLVYDIPESENEHENPQAMNRFSVAPLPVTEIYCADKENKMLHIKKSLQLQYSHHKENIPVDMFIQFPNIMVKPAVVHYDSVLLNTTRKTVVSVYNLTGCAVKFEIYKSSTAEAFYVTPHFGEIDKSIGMNKQFVNIFIYFTPRECKAYSESIRIVTNIPNYFIEVPVKGTGTINEKFYVNYKI